MIARRLLISGRVQGVFYRGWTLRQAEELELTGWVRNRAGGEVEVLVMGEPQAVAELIRRCRQGPPAAVVTGIEVGEAEPEEIEGFSQRPTV